MWSNDSLDSMVLDVFLEESKVNNCNKKIMKNPKTYFSKIVCRPT